MLDPPPSPFPMPMEMARPVRVRLGFELPVSLASDIRDPLPRIRDTWYVIVATCLDQQHADVDIFGQTTRNYGTRRARSADDEVILRFQLRAEFLLIDANALSEFGTAIRNGFRPVLLFESCLFFCFHAFFLSCAVSRFHQLTAT